MDENTVLLPETPDSLTLAADLLSAGKLVAFATETVYGLGADATQGQAVASIYNAKGRPSFNPLIAHFADASSAFAVVKADERATALAAAFWPGPLTLVLSRTTDCPISSLASAGLSTQAVRVPLVTDGFRALLRRFPGGIVAPSANPSGYLSPTTAEHVAAGLGEAVPLILDAGPCTAGLESAVVDLSGPDPRLLRHGALPVSSIEAVLRQPLTLDVDPAVKASPGQMTQHYAPNKPLFLGASRANADQAALVFQNATGFEDASVLEILSPSGSTIEAAANLFSALHRLDASNARSIVVSDIASEGLGAAINDRLRRAAAKRED
ncbi:MAG: threonylcarbamoyl-AMP synthase [Geminicoccus sp.]|nr:threonylcarbamoyl-AMP synthase [Geminicoccus sp.]